jgi:hypothetical protein
MDIKDIEKPKWAMATKRGWGMALTFAGTLLPFVNMWVKNKTGVEIDAPMVALVGEAVGGVIDAVAVATGVVLWVWGSFRPSAPITVLPPKAE